MLEKKKKKTREVRWLITFADLITLLFCFFVYLSLFSKPAVNLDTQFKVTENVLRILGEVMPLSVLSSVQTLKDQNFSSEALLVEQIEKLLGDKNTAEFKNQIILEEQVLNYQGQIYVSVLHLQQENHFLESSLQLLII